MSKTRLNALTTQAIKLYLAQYIDLMQYFNHLGCHWNESINSPWLYISLKYVLKTMSRKYYVKVENDQTIALALKPSSFTVLF